MGHKQKFAEELLLLTPPLFMTRDLHPGANGRNMEFA